MCRNTVVCYCLPSCIGHTELFGKTPNIAAFLMYFCAAQTHSHKLCLYVSAFTFIVSLLVLHLDLEVLKTLDHLLDLVHRCSLSNNNNVNYIFTLSSIIKIVNSVSKCLQTWCTSLARRTRRPWLTSSITIIAGVPFLSCITIIHLGK